MPWKLSDAYLQALKEHKNMLLAINGVGDASARGRAFSYMKEDIRKAGREEAQLAPGVKARDDGTITGATQGGLGSVGVSGCFQVSPVPCGFCWMGIKGPYRTHPLLAPGAKARGDVTSQVK
jgi:hypothetical protein